MDKKTANQIKGVWKAISAHHTINEAGQLVVLAKQLQQSCSVEVAHALMSSISVLYCRAFTDNDGVGALGPKIVKQLDAKAQATHEMLWNHRMTVGAHSDATLVDDQQNLIREVTVTATQLPESTIFGYTLPVVTLKIIHTDRILELIARITSILNETIQSRLSELYCDDRRLIELSLGSSVSWTLGLAGALEKRNA